MQLIHCHIENFGCLSQFDMDFSGGLHVIQKENGWGKSTLVAFLRIMFYGMHYEKVRDQSKKERERYRPWQGGVYGGSIVFSVGNRVYRLERSFGLKEKEDKMVLWDEQSGMKCFDYTKDIGKEIFGLDAEAYMRSILFGQADCKTYYTDQMHAKIGNIGEQTGDMEAYAQADKILAQEENRLSPQRKNGILSQMICRLQELQSQQAEKKEFENQVLSIQKQIYERDYKEKQLNAKLQSIHQILRKQEQMQIKQNLFSIYQDLLQEQAMKEEQLEETEEYFENGIPELEEVFSVITQLRQLQVNQKALEQILMTEQEQQQISIIEKWGELPNVEDLLQCKQCLSKNNGNPSQAEAECNTMPQIESIPLSHMPFVWFGICAIVLGSIASFWKIIVGICIFFIGMGSLFLAEKNRRKALEQTVEENAMESQENVEASEIDEETIYQYVQQFPIDQVTDLHIWVDTLMLITASAPSLQERWKQKEQLLEQMQMQERSIETFFIKYTIPKEEDAAQQLQSIASRLEAYQKQRTEYDQLQQKLKEMEERYPELLEWKYKHMDLDADTSTGELQGQYDQVYQEIEDIRKERIEVELALERAKADLQEKEKMLQEIPVLQEKIKKNKERYHIVVKTRECLQEARENFVNLYRNPITKNMKKYCEAFFQESMQIHVDQEGAVGVVAHGMIRSSETFSFGMQDLFGICLRFSILDVMFPDEKPYLLLDDPFVNLDQEKIEKAKSMLEMLSQQYQIIYFTCHESRV